MKAFGKPVFIQIIKPAKTIIAIIGKTIGRIRCGSTNEKSTIPTTTKTANSKNGPTACHIDVVSISNFKHYPPLQTSIAHVNSTFNSA